MHCSCFLLLVAFCFTTVSAAHELLFPQQSSYWVACGWNSIAWKSLPGDPRRVALMLVNSDKQLLNGAYDLGSALASNSSTTTGLNVYMVYVPCLSASDKYAVQFLNASGKTSAPTNVFYTSPFFTIKAAGTAPHPASGQTAIPSQAETPLDQLPSIIVPDSIQPVMEPDGNTLPSWPPFDQNMSVYFHNHKNGSATSSLTIAYLQTISLLVLMTTLVVLMS